MDLARLRELAQMSSYHMVAVVDGSVAAFLLAMREGAPYQNDNYAWFAARFPQFVYVDRIVVRCGVRRLKIGSQLYEDLFGYARSQGISAITCEYNIQPPNPASQRFQTSSASKSWAGNGWLRRQAGLAASGRGLTGPDTGGSRRIRPCGVIRPAGGCGQQCFSTSRSRGCRRAGAARRR